MTAPFSIILALAAVGLAPAGASAQALGAAAVQQISKGKTADPIRVAPVRSRGSSSSAKVAQPEGTAAAVPPAVVEACRAAQAEDRRPPEGLDCLAAMQQSAESRPAGTAESSLLELFGQRGNITGAAETRSGSSANADRVARQLSTGDVQASGDVAAGVVARGRATPPPSPR